MDWFRAATGDGGVRKETSSTAQTSGRQTFYHNKERREKKGFAQHSIHKALFLE